MKDLSMIPDIGRLYVVALKDALPYKDALLALLSDKRRKKALRYLKEEDQVRSAVGSRLIHLAVGGAELRIDERGKPYAPNGPCFSLSHGGDYITLYVAPFAVGVDVERIDRCELRLIPMAFTEEEAKGVVDERSFCFTWTRKEAVAKCEGEGIRRPKKIGYIPVAENRVLYKGIEYYVSSTEFHGHFLCLCNSVMDAFPDLELLDPKELLQ